MTGGIDDTRIVKSIIGGKIKKAREDKKLSRSQLAKELNELKDRPVINGIQEEMNIERLKQWEYGNNPINLEWIPAICDVLDCDVGYLFGEYEEKKREFSDVCEITGLSEKAVKQLYLLYHHPHCESRLGVTAKGYTIGHTDILNEIIESEGMLEFFNSLGLYLIYGGALPKDAYTSTEEELTGKECERFYKWVNNRGLEIQPRKDICEMHLQKACDELKNIFTVILERVRKDNG